MIVIFSLAGAVVVLILIAWIMDGGPSDLIDYIQICKQEKEGYKRWEESEARIAQLDKSSGLRWEHGAFVNEAPMSEAEMARLERAERAHQQATSNHGSGRFDTFEFQFKSRQEVMDEINNRRR